jgi:gliding motility-associated-like protein
MPYSLRIFLLIGLLPVLFSADAQFFLNGDAIVLNDSCYQLTPAVNNSVGSIWNPDKINLNQSFEVLVELYFGCKDFDGADGIVFGFQPLSTSIGQAGGGIGFLNVAPSLGIEMDTYQNTDFADPVFDHIAIIRNGNLNHLLPDNLVGPVQASAVSPNIEDCKFHDLRVSWDAAARRLEVYFDCVLRLTYTGNIVQTIFGGNPEVFWGFTSATGGLNNVHQVCFRYTTFLDELQDVVVCPGGQVRLEAKGGVSYRWTPTTGLNNPNVPNPIASPSQTTLYTVEIRDACDRPFFDEVLVSVAGDSVFFDIGQDTTLCEGQPLRLDAATPTAVYEWSTGANTPAVTVNEPGIYSVTVTRTDTICTASDWIEIDYRGLPQAGLGPDTTLCLGEDILLRSPFPEASYLWNTGATSDSLLVRTPGRYSISVISPCGVATDAVEVDFDDCTEIFVPNAFSPNDDGVNDLFYPLDGGDVTNISLMRIFDRWGALLFEATDFLPNDSSRGWDGKFRGRQLSPGMYVWFLQVEYRNGESETLTGEVYLMR